MAPIGDRVPLTEPRQALARARDRARLIPDCLVEARRIANTVTAGWHGRRQKGIGENFWQFRPFHSGDSVAGIDWRRSARDDHAYIREREWEAAHTIWIWPDLSPSMAYKSNLALVSKESRGLVMALAMAEILARSGERIGVPGILEPRASRNAAVELATALANAPELSGWPDFGRLGQRSDLIIFSDLLDAPETTIERLSPVALRGIAGHVIEIADPAEEDFPFTGRTEFIDPESGERLVAGRPESLADDYRAAYLARRDVLRNAMNRLGWSFVTHRTDRPASEALVSLHGRLSGNGGRR